MRRALKERTAMTLDWKLRLIAICAMADIIATTAVPGFQRVPAVKGTFVLGVLKLQRQALGLLDM
jgi:hypothetical protein